MAANSTDVTRRTTIAAVLGTMLGRPLSQLHAADRSPSDAARIDALVGRAPGQLVAWWGSGTLYAHIDGLREFAVLITRSVTLMKASATAGSSTIEWAEIGYYEDMLTGQPATSWYNPFTGKECRIPARFGAGPGRFSLNSGNGDLQVAASEKNARIGKSSASTGIVGGRFSVTLSEVKAAAFARVDGKVSGPDSDDATQVQSTIQIISSANTTAVSDEVTGFTTTVFDAVPSWLGFGDRLGNALIKGVMTRSGPKAVVDHAMLSALRTRHPTFFDSSGFVLPDRILRDEG